MATAKQVSIEDFIELYDAAHAVIDQMKMHADHAEYVGSMNQVENFRETAARIYWKYVDGYDDLITLERESK